MSNTTTKKRATKPAKTATTAGQEQAGTDGPDRMCRVTTNGWLYNEAEHAEGKVMALPEAVAKAAEKDGDVQIVGIA